MAVLLLVIGLLGWLSFFIRDEAAGQLTVPPAGSALVLNEISPSANGAVVGPSGTPTEYVELFNGTTEPVDLYNYGLSDRDDEVRWVFPRVTIEPGAYLVLYLTGVRAEGLNVDFRLTSGGGETVSLTAPNGRVIDAVKTVPVASNQVLARDAAGAWVVSELITPGHPNTPEGFQAYLASLLITDTDTSPLLINEILPRNAANWVFQDRLPEYIELLNTGAEPLELANCYLSDTTSRPFRWQLPEITLRPGELFTAYTHDSPDIALATGFRLSSETGVAVLSCGGMVLDMVEYDGLMNGLALLRGAAGSYQSRLISPGYPNDEAGVAKFMAEAQPNRAGLMISEVANQNNSVLAQNGGQFYDWVELRNNGTNPVNLADYALSTNGNRSYQLPDVTLEPGH
ncbi:MAG: lamin tail domain-containing protein, partial [Propionibacteriaceae bacterium]|nr:lamin tail domain-containing protein [Propionibacteriaceae bacterium]